MSTLLKDLYTKDVLNKIASAFSAEIQSVSEEEWIERFKQKDWNRLELKQRIRRIAAVVSEELPKPFPKALKPVLRITDRVEALLSGKEVFLAIFLGEVVEILGLEHPKDSMIAFERITKLISCEFPIRPFLIRHPALAWPQMLEWSLHPDADVRRLASEGSRPRLPWGMGIPGLKKDPQRTIKILQNLKDDPDEVVRRSVANHLNDISKDHPEFVLEIAESWVGCSKERDALLKHALRGLLKSGNQRALKLFGFSSRTNAKILNLKLNSKKVRIGGELLFGFTASSEENKKSKLRIEYKIEYAKNSGKTSKKVFQVDERLFGPQESIHYNRKQSFKQMTTRMHVPGKHVLEILINGDAKSRVDFQVVQ